MAGIGMLIAICRNILGLFGASGFLRAQSQAISRHFDDRGRDKVKVVDTANPFDLSEKSSQA
jgi:hypothetical protein